MKKLSVKQLALTAALVAVVAGPLVGLKTIPAYASISNYGSISGNSTSGNSTSGNSTSGNSTSGSSSCDNKVEKVVTQEINWSEASTKITSNEVGFAIPAEYLGADVSSDAAKNEMIEGSGFTAEEKEALQTALNNPGCIVIKNDYKPEVKTSNVASEKKDQYLQLANASSSGYAIGACLDITIKATIQSEDATINDKKIAVHRFYGTVPVAITLPDSLKQPTGVYRQYKVIREHNGEAPTVLDAYFNTATQKLEFATDKCSTFTVVYKDTTWVDSTPAASSSSSSNSSEEKESKKDKETVYVDYDTFKSELPSKTVTAAIAGDSSFMDLKAHAPSDTTVKNQKVLAAYYAKQLGFDANVVLSYDIYTRSDLSLTQNGQKRVLTWTNTSAKTPGAIYAVVYNQIDGAYLISGIVDANGTAVFNDFVVRPASSITIFTAR